MGRLKIQTWPDRQTVPTTTTPLTPHQHIDKNNAPTHDSRLRSRSCFMSRRLCHSIVCVCVQPVGAIPQRGGDGEGHRNPVRHKVTSGDALPGAR